MIAFASLIADIAQLTQQIDAESDCLTGFSTPQIRDSATSKIVHAEGFAVRLGAVGPDRDDMLTLTGDQQLALRQAIATLVQATERNADLLRQQASRVQNLLDHVVAAATPIARSVPGYGAQGHAMARGAIAPIMVNAQI